MACGAELEPERPSGMVAVEVADGGDMEASESGCECEVDGPGYMVDVMVEQRVACFSVGCKGQGT